jgi:mono/diheme cytochrome c family protein
VVPILQANCYGCHSGNTTNGGIDLTDYATVAFLAQNGTLSGVINHTGGYKPMPPSSKLDSCDIAKIDKWISDTTFTDPPDEGHPCDPDTVYFQNEVLPLILSTCSTTGCHDKLTEDQDILLVDYASIIAYGEIEPGDPEESKLFKVITDDDPDDRMPPPPKTPLNADQISKIRTWISQGAKDNYCDESCDTTNVTFSGTVWPILETSCVGCHSGPAPQGGINLSNYTNVVEVANTGKLYGAISHSQGYSPMPKNLPKLSDCKIEQVKIWIDDGTPNN